MNFKLTTDQEDLIAVWEVEQNKQWAAKHGRVYYGAIGGSLTYSFSPTSIGTIIKVSHVNGNELDVSDYQDW